MNRILLLLCAVILAALIPVSLAAEVSDELNLEQTRSYEIDQEVYDVTFVASDGDRARFLVNGERTHSLETGEVGFVAGLFLELHTLSASARQHSGGMVEFCLQERSASEQCTIRDVLAEGQTRTYTLDGVGDYEVQVLSISEEGVRFMVDGEATSYLDWDVERAIPINRMFSEVSITVHDLIKTYSEGDARASFTLISPNPLPLFPFAQNTVHGSSDAPLAQVYVDVAQQRSRDWLHTHVPVAVEESDHLQLDIRPILIDFGEHTEEVLWLMCSAEQDRFFEYMYAFVDQPEGVSLSTRREAAAVRSGVSQSTLERCVRADSPGLQIQTHLQEWMDFPHDGTLPLFVAQDTVTTERLSIAELIQAAGPDPRSEPGRSYRYGMVFLSDHRPVVLEEFVPIFGGTAQRVSPADFRADDFSTAAVFVIRNDDALVMLGERADAEYVRLVMAGAQLLEDSGMRVQTQTTADARGKTLTQSFEEAPFTGAPQPIDPERESVDREEETQESEDSAQLRVRISQPTPQSTVSGEFTVVVQASSAVSRIDYFFEGVDGGLAARVSHEPSEPVSFDVSSVSGDQAVILAQAFDRDGRMIEDQITVTVEREETEEPQEPEEVAEPVVCDGCMLEDRCLSVGLRLEHEGENVYCSLSGDVLTQQAAETSCNNDFECETNQCSSGVCVDLRAEIEEARGMFERIAEWFGRFFGR